MIATNLALGTMRSIQAPRKFVPGQTRQRRGTPTNRTSSSTILFVMFGSLLLHLPVIYLCRHFHMPWLASLIFGPFAVAAVATYALMLRNAEQLILSHRDVLSEELCKSLAVAAQGTTVPRNRGAASAESRVVYDGRAGTGANCAGPSRKPQAATCQDLAQAGSKRLPGRARPRWLTRSR